MPKLPICRGKEAVKAFDIYRIKSNQINILAVVHGAQLLTKEICDDRSAAN